jgi:arginine-tRNA-protein transferase
MAYKSRFYPTELLINQQWHRFDEAVTAAQVEPLLQQAIKTHYLNMWNTT